MTELEALMEWWSLYHSVGKVAMVTMLLIGVIGCGAPPAPLGSAGEPPPALPHTIKRVTLGVRTDQDLHPYGPGPSGQARPLVNPGLTITDEHNVRRAVLVEGVPSVDHGDWKLFPDGRMETTWTLRAEASWADGVPLTTEDLLFTLEVGRTLPVFRSPAYQAIDTATAKDERTLTVSWRRAYIDADALFGYGVSVPLPAHVLAAAYRDNPDGFPDLPFWTQDYVGPGPFAIEAWTPGTELRLRPVSAYPLGHPRIDELQLRIISDPNTLITNVLAGEIDVLAQVGSIEQGSQLRQQWPDGTVVVGFEGATLIGMFPQFVGPKPSVIADVRFRRALLYAADRQGIADTLALGLSPVAHSFMNPDQSAYREIEARLPHYDFDPRKAEQLMGELELSRGPDGAYMDRDGSPLELEVRSGALDQAAKPAESLAADWRRIGLPSAVVRETAQRAEDFAYRASFPAVLVRGQLNDVVGLGSLASTRARLPENIFRAPSPENWSRYQNSELDTLLDRYQAAVPLPDRLTVLGEILYLVADQVVVGGIYYVPNIDAVSNRILNVRPSGPRTAWNAHEWDVK